MNDDSQADRLKFAVWASPDEEALVQALAAFDPAFATALSEHLEEYDYVLSTVWLADVVRWANERYLNGDQSRVTSLLALLEDRYKSGDRYVRELIATGFVESMDPAYAPAGGMRSLLGPLLSAEYATVYPKWP